MSEPHKKHKADKNSKGPDFEKIYAGLLQATHSIDDHPYVPLLEAVRSSKKPILQAIQPTVDVYKSNPEKKKKPIEMYLDTVSHLYKKRDLDILINPVTPHSVFEFWAPREIAIFEESILKFGKQFEFIAELIGTKNFKEVYEFYLEWKSTSHHKSYRSFVSANNRNNIEDLV
jgi:hypothetical protein